MSFEFEEYQNQPTFSGPAKSSSGKMVDKLIKWGFIKNESQGKMVLVGVAITFILTTLVILTIYVFPGIFRSTPDPKDSQETLKEIHRRAEERRQR